MLQQMKKQNKLEAPHATRCFQCLHGGSKAADPVCLKKSFRATSLLTLKS